MKSILKKYAELLVNYSISVQPGEKVYVVSTTLAEPLVREVYRAILEAGGHPHINMSFRGQDTIFFNHANEEQLKYIPPTYKAAMEEFDCYLYIRAPFNLSETAALDKSGMAAYGKARKPYRDIYSQRTATRSLKRNLCEYPTLAFAQNAGLSLEAYQDFIFNACKLTYDNPMEKWLEVRAYQQDIVDFLNQKSTIRYKRADSDISFSVAGRTWINSDGQTNMPSGEVYTCPVEDSVNGVIHFDYPAIRYGKPLEGVTLWVEDGEVVKWEAKQGQDSLDRVFQVKGARRFGEAAIGTNMDIQKAVKNILFDEKIGGTIHMAVGQSYLQTGGKNQSAIHWDFITDMMNGGEIYADDELIYQSGKFLFL